MEAINYN